MIVLRVVASVNINYINYYNEVKMKKTMNFFKTVRPYLSSNLASDFSAQSLFLSSVKSITSSLNNNPLLMLGLLFACLPAANALSCYPYCYPEGGSWTCGIRCTHDL